MATYYVDDGGSATDPYDTWAKAATSLSALDDAKALASGDIIYIGHDHVCAYTHAANRTITGPTSGAPCIIISATQGSSPPTYAASSTAQIDTTEGAYSITFDGSFAAYGVRIVSGAGIALTNDINERGEWHECTFKPAANGAITYGGTGSSVTILKKCSIDLGSDASSNRTATVLPPGADTAYIHAFDLTFSTASWRTGAVFGGSGYASGCDFSGFTNATPCELHSLSNMGGPFVFQNCKTAATWALNTGNPSGYMAATLTAVNVGPTDAPQYLRYVDWVGTLDSDTVTRTSGATVEGTATSWKITTTAACTEQHAFCTPWIYGVCSGTGSKTFTVYIGNNTADLTDAECWLEVESMGDAGGSPLSELTTDHRTITTTAAAQTDDTGSTWSSAQTYMQSLAVTATVEQAGLFRARVAVAKASVTNLYVDSTVFVDGVAASSQYLLPSGIIGVTSGSTGGAGLVGSGRGLVG